MNGGVGGGGASKCSDTQRRRNVQDTIVYRLTSKRLAAQSRLLVPVCGLLVFSLQTNLSMFGVSIQSKATSCG